MLVAARNGCRQRIIARVTVIDLDGRGVRTLAALALAPAGVHTGGGGARWPPAYTPYRLPTRAYGSPTLAPRAASHDTLHLHAARHLVQTQ